MLNEPIAVLAGTPVDTRMGVDCLTGAGLSGAAFPLAEGPRQQTAFQISSPEEKHARVLEVLRTAMDQGCQKVFVYCTPSPPPWTSVRWRKRLGFAS